MGKVLQLRSTQGSEKVSVVVYVLHCLESTGLPSVFCVHCKTRLRILFETSVREWTVGSTFEIPFLRIFDLKKKVCESSGVFKFYFFSRWKFLGIVVYHNRKKKTFWSPTRAAQFFKSSLTGKLFQCAGSRMLKNGNK